MNKLLLALGLIFMLEAVSVTAQTGLFGNAGAPFLTVGVFILIIFFIGDQLFRQMRGKK